MDYIQLLQQRIQIVNDNVITGLIYDEYFKLEPEIIKLQKEQLDKGIGFDDGFLKSGNSNFKGVYSATTSNFASLDQPYPSLTSKTAGQKYNFVWGGDFMNNFRIKRQNKGLEIYSTGTGSGDKQAFFEGYTNMFGLNSENTSTIESEVLYYVYEKVFTRLYQ
jgi:hypothetical protein